MGRRPWRSKAPPPSRSSGAPIRPPLGSIFYDLGEDKVAERVGLFAFLLTFLLSSTTEALPIFLQEREILAKEMLSGMSLKIKDYARVAPSESQR